MKKATFPNARVSRIARLIAMISMLMPSMVSAQYYPAPPIVSEEQEAGLLRQLKAQHSKLKEVDLLLKLSNIHYNKPIKSFNDFPIATRYANQARDLSLKLKNTKKQDAALFSLATIYLLEDSLKKAEKLLPAVQDSVIKNNIQIGLAYTYIFCPETTITDWIGPGKSNAEEAVTLSSRLGLVSNNLLARQILAYVHTQLGNAKGGEDELMNIINEYKTSHIDGIQYPYLILFDFHWSEGNFAAGTADVQKALEAVEKSSDKTALADVYEDQVIIFGRIAEHGKESVAAQAALDNFKLRLSRYTPADVIYDIANRLTKIHQNQQALDYVNAQTKIFPPITEDAKSTTLGAYAKCYLALGQYKKAEECYLKNFQLAKDRGLIGTNNYRELAYFYIEHKEFRKARPYLLKALQLYNKNTSPYALRHITYMLFLADSAAGDYFSAMQYLKINHRLDDSLENTKRQADVQKLLIQFETQKKETEIKNLKQKETVARLNQERANVTRNIVIAAAVLFLVIAAVFYRQFRSKKKLSDEISKKNRRLEALVDRFKRVLTEKEWLLKEVHHRVKNNLHTVMCLLESQASYLENDALQAIEVSKHRIYAMSLIHQRLYETENMKSIDLKSYIAQFVGYLKDSFSLGDKIRFELDIESLQLEVAVAIPIALIINEAITNSIKHAFPGNLRGIIKVTLYKTGESLQLKIEDDGVGIADTNKIIYSKSLGMKLINGLTEDLNGNLSIRSVNGTQISIICSLNPFDKELEENQQMRVAD